MDDKINFVKDVTPKYYHTNVFLNDINFVNNIYELFKNDIMFIPKTTSEMVCIALYYLGKDDYSKMVDYYEMAIKLGDDIAALLLGNFCDDDSGDGKVTYYYKLAIAKGNNEAMYRLGKYYKKCNNNKQMLNYYEMASDNGNVMGMWSLGEYYENKGDYDTMLKYYVMGVSNGSEDCMCSLGDYYRRVKKYTLMEKYYLMAANYNISYVMYKLGRYYGKIKNYKKMKMYIMMAINLDCEVYNYQIEKFYNNIYFSLEFLANIQDPICEIINVMETIIKKDMNDKQKDIIYMITSNYDIDKQQNYKMSSELRLLLHFSSKK